VSSSLERKFASLRSAAKSRDADLALAIWRDMSEREQEDMVVHLLALRDRQAPATAELISEGRVEPDDIHGGIGDGPTKAGQTELVPVSIDILHELSASNDDFGEGPRAPQSLSVGMTEYRARWRQRWKWSALVAAWATTTIFAFTGETTNFGPAEWTVSILMTVVGGGLLVGTLINLAVAAIPSGVGDRQVLDAVEPARTQP